MRIPTPLAPLACLVLLGCAALPAHAQTPTPKSLVIAIDGARADAIEIAAMPNLRRLIDGDWRPGYRGAYAYQAQTIKDADTWSGPNHTSIFTAVTRAKHGVTGNHANQMAAVDELHYQTVLELHDPALDTVKLATWGLDAEVPNAADYLKISSDAGSTDIAEGMLAGTFADGDWSRGRDVDAMFVFFDDVDHAGHAHGWLGNDYYAALETTDARIGRILDAIAARPGFADEDWQIVVTSDHGGYGTGHGPQAAVYYTIPFLVAGRSAAQGVIDGRARNSDTAATVLSHFGIDPGRGFQRLDDGSVYTLDGRALGASVRATPPASITSGLVANLRLENDYADASGRGNHLAVGAGAPAFINGKFGRAVQIAGSGGQGREYLSFGNDKPDLDFGGVGANADDFTITMWYRAGAQSGDPAIIGNKNWDSGRNAGLLLTAAVSGGNELGLNLADTDRRRADGYRIDTAGSGSQWWLLALTVDRRNGLSTLYAGSPDGKLYFVANEIDALQDLGSSLPLNIGQDGTGTYSYQLKADIDDIGIWRRALDKSEIQTLHDHGNGREIDSLVPICR